MSTFAPCNWRGCTISIDTQRVTGVVDPLIYSGFIEHMGRGIYGGVYDKGSKLSDANGFRQDVLKALRDELKIPLYRYPGGNFTATYHWKDGIGPQEKRPTRLNLAWGGVETNQFGTDEFMKWCAQARAKPCICLNMGTGTLDEALEWLEYCNSSGQSSFAQLRRQNGREEPYNVKYWELGNEAYGDWQVAPNSPAEYAAKAVQWAKALEKVDPSIKLILCCENGFGEWERVVIDAAATFVDYVSIHNFTYSKDHMQNFVAPYVAEKGIQITTALIDLAFIQHHSQLPDPPPARPKICFNEWNVWDMKGFPGERGSEQVYTLSDALAVASWLNVFVRNAKHVGIASPAQSVNAISSLHVHEGGILKHATYPVFWLFANFMKGRSLAVHVSSKEYKGATTPEWLQHTQQMAFLDVSATLDVSIGFLNLMIVNRYLEAKEVDLKLFTGEHSYRPTYRFEVSGKSLFDSNSIERHGIIRVVELGSSWGNSVELPKHSVTLFRWKLVDN